MHTPFVLPKLPYSYDALEPYIDARTMEVHYTGHHQAYVDKLNQALSTINDTAQTQPLEELLKNLASLPVNVQTTVRNNGGGHYNHSFFWTILGPAGQCTCSRRVLEAIKTTFGSFEQFQQQFESSAQSVFGSGWAWLCVAPTKKLTIVTTPNQDNPIMQGLTPILGLDVWEHAYYLKYLNKRANYIKAWWNIIDWDMVEQYYLSTC